MARSIKIQESGVYNLFSFSPHDKEVEITIAPNTHAILFEDHSLTQANVIHHYRVCENASLNLVQLLSGDNLEASFEFHQASFSNVILNQVLIVSSAENKILVKKMDEGESTLFNSFATIIGNSKSQLFHEVETVLTKMSGKSEHQLRSLISQEAKLSANNVVKVGANISGIETKQVLKSINLDKSAKSLLKPILEINSQDVKCNHGATIGQLGSEEISYLMSRGLTPHQARMLLLKGFVGEFLTLLPTAEIAKKIIPIIDYNLLSLDTV